MERIDKISYNPPAEKRFAISRDLITQERLNFIRDLQKKLTQDIGIPIGITLFGSITKGKELSSEEIVAKTDIDFTVFYDLDEVIKNFNEICTKFPDLKESYDKIHRHHSYTINHVIDCSFKLFIKSYIGKIVSASRDLYSFDALPLKANDLEDIELQKTIMDNRDVTIMRMFQLDVGGVMTKYRSIFLEALSKKDKKTRDYIWYKITQSIRFNERHNDDQDIKYLPETFEAAYEKYVKE